MIHINKITNKCITFSRMNMLFNSRIFWRELATWTRVFFISSYAGIGNAQEVFARLHNVPDELTAMLRLILGPEASEGYYKLLEEHILLIQILVNAQMAGNIDGINQTVSDLYKNGEKRAAFLAQYNPFWSESAWRNYINIYIQYTIEESDTFIADDYNKNIELYGRLINHTNDMGRYYSQGLFTYMTYDQNIQGQYLKLTNRYSINRYQDQCFTNEQMNTIFNLRMFWYELAIWTRAYMESKYAEIGISDEVFNRLQQVPVDYNKLLTRLLGEKIAAQFLQVFNTHIDLIDALITAQLEGDIDKINEITQLLYQNADQSATYLTFINPYFDLNEMKRLFYNYTRSTLQESSTFSSRDYARNINTFDQHLDQSKEIGDYFAKNIFDYLSYLPKIE